jgi:glycosyltransferase involved in cell wall biosynthesis
MYVIATHIPIYTDGRKHCVDISWQRDLILARDWLAQPYGGLTVIAPSLSLNAGNEQGLALVPIGQDDGIHVVPSFNARGRARQFWMRDRHLWNSDVKKVLETARILHTSDSDVFRPFTFMAHSAAVKAGVPTVFVGPDMDVHVILPRNLKGRLQCMVFDFLMRRALAHTKLGLLKEGLVHDRYQRYGKNVKAMCHSMHSRSDVIGVDALEKRLRTLGPHRPLRAVYAGRFVRRKGLHDAIDAVASAGQAGAAIELHLYGGGPEEQALRTQANRLGVSDRVFFHGVAEYGNAFIRSLSDYDLFLFMPTEEDTPRALFDTMAAGLPTLGTDIPFLKTRSAQDHQSTLVPIGDFRAAAQRLSEMCRDVELLCKLSRNAQAAGLRHSVEEWYGRRAQWTSELGVAT